MPIFDQRSVVEEIKHWADINRVPIKFTPESIWHPSVLERRVKKSKSKYDEATGKVDTREKITISVPYDECSKGSKKYDLTLFCFSDGNAEDYCLFRAQMEHCFQVTKSLDQGAKKHNYFHSALRGQALKYYMSAYNEVMQKAEYANAAASNEDYLKAMQEVFDEFGMNFFESPETAYKTQKRYLMRKISIGNQNPKNVGKRVNEISDQLPFFPRPRGFGTPKPLEEEQKIEILDEGAKMEWKTHLLRAGQSTMHFTTLKEATEFYERMYLADRTEAQILKEKGGAEKKKKQASRKRSHKNDEREERKPSKNFKSQGKDYKSSKPDWKKQKYDGNKHFQRDMKKHMNEQFSNMMGEMIAAQIQQYQADNNNKRKAAPQQEDSHVMDLSETLANQANLKDYRDSDENDSVSSRSESSDDSQTSNNTNTSE